MDAISLYTGIGKHAPVLQEDVMAPRMVKAGVKVKAIPAHGYAHIRVTLCVLSKLFTAEVRGNCLIPHMFKS